MRKFAAFLRHEWEHGSALLAVSVWVLTWAVAGVTLACTMLLGALLVESGVHLALVMTAATIIGASFLQIVGPRK